MILLGIDTSTARSSVAVTRDGVLVARAEHEGARSHGAFLAPAIVACLTQAGVSSAELHGVAVGVGPGLYTGLRVGMATAAAIATAHGLPAVGVISLDALAFGALSSMASPHVDAAAEDSETRTVWATLDARRGQVFWARYESDGSAPAEGFAREGGPVVGTRSQFDATVAEVAARTGRAPHVVGEVGTDVVTLPDAADLLQLAAQRFARGETVAPEALAPQYLRDADVRIGWAERGGGRDPRPEPTA